MKHIKIEVLRTKWGNKVLRIVEQTHRGVDFGIDSDGVFEHNGFSLRSSEYPSALPTMDALYVRGSSKEDDNRVVCVPSEEWLNALRDAVKAYNRFFANHLEEDENVEVIE